MSDTLQLPPSLTLHLMSQEGWGRRRDAGVSGEGDRGSAGACSGRISIRLAEHQAVAGMADAVET